MQQYQIPPELLGSSRGRPPESCVGPLGVRRDEDDGAPVPGGMRATQVPRSFRFWFAGADSDTRPSMLVGRYRRRLWEVDSPLGQIERGTCDQWWGHWSSIRIRLDGGLDTEGRKASGGGDSRNVIDDHNKHVLLPQTRGALQVPRWKLVPSRLDSGKWAGGGGKPDTCITEALLLAALSNPNLGIALFRPTQPNQGDQLHAPDI